MRETERHTAAADRKSAYEETVRKFRGAVLFTHDFSAISEVLTPDFVDHFAPPWDPPGREGVAHRFGQAAEALTTRRVEVLTSVCEGDVLAQAILLHFEHTGAFMGLPPTGRAFAIGGSNTFRFRDGRIAEHWGVFDVAKIPDLLGGPAPGGAAPGGAGGWSSMWPGAPA
ncbi:ester cyclase [Streptomyces sp. UNOB3_S3]|uniref:ester cyclase n=1 Tax=Streptomyces sp. UNOB3_S3 TaxID=2871682 RepID=UPI001E528756|nr:ester cyclase [Streptomyces sp. UNOB3_S3]MCC3778618.1 ester cyclase [Streptomyces sp. UNOB3_S3]